VIEFRFRTVDVFSARALAGNGLAVMLDPCPDPLMQAVAREFNLSETTFPVVTADDEYEVRIFTPNVELPFAGHPSLGTAWALGPGRWTQHSPGATVVVEATADGAVMSQPDPVLEELDAEPFVRALGLPSAVGAWRATAGGMTHLVVATTARLDRVVPDQAALTRAAKHQGGTGAAVVSRLDDTSLHVRVFLPGIGVSEDPGTGSAAGPVGLLARDVFGTAADVTIRQGDEMGRPCRIEVHAEAGNIRVGGRVAACSEGRLTLDHE
jgi:trans-2,3-dihydro-3-hydroxyanthranilate isomerase